MGGNQQTTCILCGESDFQQVFTSGDGFKSPPLERRGNKLISRTCTVLSCTQCGLGFRKDLSGQKIERHKASSGDLPHFAEESIRVTPLRVIPDRRISPHSGFEELEEMKQFINPPGAFLNIGNDDFDIIETARLTGWHSSVYTSYEEILGYRDDSSLEITGQGSRFDVVRLEGSLERAENPFTYLEQISGMLGRNGLLVVSTLDFTAWNFSISGEGPSVGEADQLQRWFFTPRTAEKLLITAGFEVLRVSEFTASFELADAADLFGKHTELPASGHIDNDLILPPPQQIPCFRVFARRFEKRTAYQPSLQTQESLPASQTGIL